ncbi:MAG: sterol desaturase family protein [Woeseia sp.]
MDLIALAVPFFLLALLFELVVDRIRSTGYFRTNDAINSLSAGRLSTTTGYFTRFIQVFIWGYALQHFGLFQMQIDWFDFSPRGVLLWTVALIGWDFCYYWSHRLGHEVSILWDRMFGSFQEELDTDPVVFGVRKPLANRHPFWANIQKIRRRYFDSRPMLRNGPVSARARRRACHRQAWIATGTYLIASMLGVCIINICKNNILRAFSRISLK